MHTPHGIIVFIVFGVAHWYWAGRICFSSSSSFALRNLGQCYIYINFIRKLYAQLLNILCLVAISAAAATVSNPLLLVRNKSHFGFGIAIRAIFAHKLGRFTFFHRIYFSFNIQCSISTANSIFFPISFSFLSLLWILQSMTRYDFSTAPQENRFGVRSINNYFHASTRRGGLFEREGKKTRKTNKIEEQIVERTSHPRWRGLATCRIQFLFCLSNQMNGCIRRPLCLTGLRDFFFLSIKPIDDE